MAPSCLHEVDQALDTHRGAASGRDVFFLLPAMRQALQADVRRLPRRFRVEAEALGGMSCQ